MNVVLLFGLRQPIATESLIGLADGKALDASLEKGLKKPWFEVHHEHVF